MTQWDGLTSANATGIPQRICILGATNRIQDIDEAILRRMPKKFPVSLPSASQRANIFRLILRGTKVDQERFDLDWLVKVSAGMSGSDIKDCCRDAAMAPVREYIKKIKKEGGGLRGVDARDVRGVRTEDFFGTRGSVHNIRGVPVKQDIDEVDDDSDDRDRKIESVSTTSSSTGETEEDFRDSAYHETVKA